MLSNLNDEFSMEELHSIWDRVSSAPPPEELFQIITRSNLNDSSSMPKNRENAAAASENSEQQKSSPYKNLYSMIEDEAELCRIYIKLTRLAAQKNVTKTLFELANEQFTLLRSIASVCFLITGDYFFPWDDRKTSNIQSYLQGMKSAWTKEVTLCEGYKEYMGVQPANLSETMKTIKLSHENHLKQIIHILDSGI
jgi:hypothetical protein